MTPEFRVDPAFNGPSLAELLPILDDLQDPVDIKFLGTRADYLTLERAPARQFVLVVPDTEVRGKATGRLGGSLHVTKEDFALLKKALTSRKDTLDWRLRVGAMGREVGTLLLCKIVSSALQAGKNPRAAVDVARDCVLRRTDPVDADVILRLRFGS